MAYKDLRAYRAYIDALEKAGELKRIQLEVDPILEISDETERVRSSEPRPIVAARGR